MGGSRVPAATLAVALAVTIGLGCALPPEYPRDEQHLAAADSSRECFDCHVKESGPRPHPSHFEEDGRFKVKRRDCHDCHRAAVPEPGAGAKREHAP